MKLSAHLQVSVIDADPTLYHTLLPFFQAAGAELKHYARAEHYLEGPQRHDRRVVVASELPGMSGLDLMHRLRERGNDVEAVLVVHVDDVPSAVRAMRLGAVDVVTRPVDVTRLLTALSAGRPSPVAPLSP